MDIPPPKCLQAPLRIPNNLLMGPGPANCSPRVMKALSEPVLNVFDTNLLRIMDEVKEGIRYVFQTKNDLTLALTTAGHGGMEAIFCNLTEPGNKILVAVNGIWGQRAADMAGRYGANVSVITTPMGDNFTLAEIENAIQRDRPKLFFIAHGESSTGVYQPIEGIGPVCRRYNCLFAVDAVVSLGSVPLFQDKWEIDALYTGSQKALGGVPGIAPISLSKRAQDVLFRRKTPVPVFYLDLKILGDQWNCYGRPRTYHHTLSSQVLYALREALAQIAEERLENTINRHKLCAQLLHAGLQKLNLTFFVKDENKRLPSVTTVYVPDNINFTELQEYCRKNCSVDLIGGLGPTAGQIIRLGIIGYNATPYNVDLLLKSLSNGIDVQKRRQISKL